MGEPFYRYATQADAPALVALIERAYRGPEMEGSWVSEAHLLKGPRTSLKEIADLIARSDSVFLMAELDGRLAGCCLLQGLKPVGQDTAPATACAPKVSMNAVYFGMFAIEPRTHGSGLGKAMMAEAERRIAKLWNADVMVMTVINLRTELIKYYERRGYRLTGATIPFPFTETSGETTRDFHLVEMRKTLA